MPTFVSIIYLLLYRLGVIADNHINQTNRGAEACLAYCEQWGEWIGVKRSV